MFPSMVKAGFSSCSKCRPGGGSSILIFTFMYPQYVLYIYMYIQQTALNCDILLTIVGIFGQKTILVFTAGLVSLVWKLGVHLLSHSLCLKMCVIIFGSAEQNIRSTYNTYSTFSVRIMEVFFQF